jgi:hypothetical protein
MVYFVHFKRFYIQEDILFTFLMQNYSLFLISLSLTNLFVYLKYMNKLPFDLILLALKLLNLLENIDISINKL